MQRFMLIAFCLVGSSVMFSASGPKPPSELMEKKTKHAQNILRYLATGDLKLVKSESEQLKKITEEAGFSDKNERYAEYGREFLKAVSELQKAAQDENMADSYYQFSRMTSVCFSCHEHIRKK